MLERVISASLGEIVLKGLNRKYFEDRLIKNMKRVLSDFGEFRIYKEQGKIYIEGLEDHQHEAIKRLKKVFGLVYISPCIRTSLDMEDIREAGLKLVRESLPKDKITTFKVETSRSDKRYPLKSPEISRDIGGYVLTNTENLKVDVHNPDFMLYVDVKEYGYVYIDRTRAYGGLPIGTNGKGLLLLSGGIDSPVAGFMMAKRGVEVDAIHFHSYPFTTQRAEEKVMDLARIVSMYTGPMKIYSINLLNIQKEINEKCPEDEMTILSRRFMMRIAEEISKKKGYQILVTGENLGQVASQTIYSIDVINRSVQMPILRPLVGMDKVDIIDMSKEIETYETSIKPFEDCCSVFLPKHPVTRPKIEDIEQSEQALNIDELVLEAIEGMRITKID